MHPLVRFVTTKDGVRIAYCTHGDGPPLVLVRGWMSHLELLWEDPDYRRYFEALSRHYRLVRYDCRGNGLSDRQVPEIDLQALVMDLEAVVDELSLTDVILYGSTFGGPIAITYTDRHRERVSKLILDGTYARGQEITTPERQASIIATLSKLPEAGLLLLGHLTHPEPQQPSFRRLERLRQAISPVVATQLYSLCFKMDVSAVLSEIRVPTLVMHRRGSHSIPFELGRELASHIPDARFVALQGTAHNSWEGDAAAALGAVGDFLGTELELTPAARADKGQAPLTILFTDVEGSTALTRRLGDAKARAVLREHEGIVREALRAHGGAEVKTIGDGFMTSFSSATGALECAVAMQRAFAERNASAAEPIRVRVGLNAGEPIAEDEDLYGTAVNLAARICGHAKAGQILAPIVVRELAAGKDFLFADRGDVALRGFDDPVRLFELRWREEG